MRPVEAAQRALARAVSAEMHSGFRALRQRMPMNCRAHNREVKLVPALEADIGRVLSIWSECRQARTESGDWLFGRFSIADAMYVPVALRFHSYSVKLPEVARNYVESVLQDPAVSDWMRAGAAECEIIEADDSWVLNERTDRFLIGDTWVVLLLHSTALAVRCSELSRRMACHEESRYRPCLNTGSY